MFSCMWKIFMLEPVEEWFFKITQDDPVTAKLVLNALEHLQNRGPREGRPLVDRIKGSRIHNLKELRPGSSKNTEVRMLFVFDPDRQAVFLVAGDKSGQWDSWYRKNIPLAEKRYRDYLDNREDDR
jgi:hypothetical protein